jgi:large subunit ribosomal protein L25
MANTELKVAPRAVLGKKVKQLRRQGWIPANVYGHKVESTSVQAPTPDLLTLMRKLSRNEIINLTVEGEKEPRTVVVRDVARDPVTGNLLHVDFYQVSMTEKMRTEVPVVLTGTSPAVATHGGVLLQTLERVAVEALPGDIPQQFEVDVSRLVELEQSFHVSDLDVDTSKVTLHTDPEVVLARVASPRLATAEEEAAEAAEAAEGVEGAPAEGAPPAEEKPAEASGGESE